MPTSFPHYDPDTDELVPRSYYSVSEVAELLHVSESLVYKRCREGVWDCLRVNRHYFLNGQQVGDALAAEQTYGHGLDTSGPVTLGVPLADPDTESLR